MTEEAIDKLIKLIAESDSLTQIGEKYINYLYFETAIKMFSLTALLGGIVYAIYRIAKYNLND